MGEHDYEVSGTCFALRSTSAGFLAAVDEVLGAFRIQAPEPLWPVFSVVAPSPAGSSRRGVRPLHVGYVNHVEIFRYAEPADALGAVLAGIDAAGRAQLARRCCALGVEALVVDGRAVVVYGPGAALWAADLMARGATPVCRPKAILELSSARVVPWPLCVTSRPDGIDRRGARFAPLAEKVGSPVSSALTVAVVVRASSGPPVHPAQVVAELMALCPATGAGRHLQFCSVAKLVASAEVLSAARLTPGALKRLTGALEQSRGGIRRQRAGSHHGP